ncbi:MAG: hypothetical protein ABIE03_04745 [Patescibacteria group bacterium]|nr:hypothetical protein [Patescibacteria group bacterium]
MKEATTKESVEVPTRMDALRHTLYIVTGTFLGRYELFRNTEERIARYNQKLELIQQVFDKIALRQPLVDIRARVRETVADLEQSLASVLGGGAFSEDQRAILAGSLESLKVDSADDLLGNIEQATAGINLSIPNARTRV